MQNGAIVSWVVRTCTGLVRRSQAKTLGELVGGAIRCRRATLADIGRSMSGKALAKHKIKRVDRFLGNHREEVANALWALVAIAGKAAGGRLFVLVDWVDVMEDKVLVGSVPIRGRSMPVVFAGYEKGKIFKQLFAASLAQLLKKN